MIPSKAWDLDGINVSCIDYLYSWGWHHFCVQVCVRRILLLINVKDHIERQKNLGGHSLPPTLFCDDVIQNGRCREIATTPICNSQLATWQSECTYWWYICLCVGKCWGFVTVQTFLKNTARWRHGRPANAIFAKICIIFSLLLTMGVQRYQCSLLCNISLESLFKDQLKTVWIVSIPFCWTELWFFVWF